MAVMPINAPGLNHPFNITIMAGPAHMIHDLIMPLLQDRLAHPAGNLIQSFLPGGPLPFTFPAPAGPLEWIENSLWIINLVFGRWPLSAVSSPAARMERVAFKLLCFERLFIYISQQAAGALAVETDRRDQ